MVGQFLTLVRKGDVVTALGTFDPQNQEINHATVLFMVVQGENDSMVWTHGNGEWHRDDPDHGNNWIGTASAEGDGVRGTRGWLDPAKDNGTVRGIAVALVVLPAQPGQGDAARFEPPTIQALTWCVSTKLVASDATQVADAMGVPA
jgi:hypothetical protein